MAKDNPEIPNDIDEKEKSECAEKSQLQYKLELYFKSVPKIAETLEKVVEILTRGIIDAYEKGMLSLKSQICSKILIAAIENNEDLERVKKILEDKAEVNFYEGKTSPLKEAIRVGRVDIVELLLANKADVFTKDWDDNMPLDLLNNSEILIQYNLNIDKVTQLKTILQKAMQNSADTNITKKMLNDPNIIENETWAEEIKEAELTIVADEENELQKTQRDLDIISHSNITEEVLPTHLDVTGADAVSESNS